VRFTVEDIAAVTRGAVVGPATTIDGAAIDSRTIRGGELFVPLVAERDGHDFIDAALERGAAAYLTARDPRGGTAIRVDDTMAALTRLGAVARDRLPDAVAGITGSVGKTSVKDLLAGVLATTFRTTASAKSFNNEIGVPLTLLGAPDDTEVAVLEMGARGIGHIRTLCDVGRPTTAVVTMVAEVHTSEYPNGLDDVERAKGELVEAVPVDGAAVLNGSDPRVRRMARLTDARVLLYGVSGDVVAQRVEVDDQLRPRFRLSSPWGTVDVQLGVHGVHQVGNALAAAAAGLAQGVPLEAVAEGLAGAALSPWRMELGRTPGGARVLNDAYNSNPTALEAALHALAALDAERRIAVLGVMAELGPSSDDRHREMGELAEDLDIEVVTVACPAYGVGTEVASPEEAAALLAGERGPLDEGVAVLVKASRSAGLERVASLLGAS